VALSGGGRTGLSSSGRAGLESRAFVSPRGAHSFLGRDEEAFGGGLGWEAGAEVGESLEISKRLEAEGAQAVDLRAQPLLEVLPAKHDRWTVLPDLSREPGRPAVEVDPQGTLDLMETAQIEGGRALTEVGEELGAEMDRKASVGPLSIDGEIGGGDEGEAYEEGRALGASFVAPDLEAQVDESPELFADLVARAIGAAGVVDVEESTEVGPGVRKVDLRCLSPNGFGPEMGEEEPRVAARGETRSGRGAEGQGEPLLAQGPGERRGVGLRMRQGAEDPEGENLQAVGGGELWAERGRRRLVTVMALLYYRRNFIGARGGA
jgi:hypothetical protein